MYSGRLTCEVGIVLWVDDDRVDSVVCVNVEQSVAEIHISWCRGEVSEQRT
jgi:hypothetical protein